MLDTLTTTLYQSSLYFLDANQRIFWLYILSSLVLTLALIKLKPQHSLSGQPISNSHRLTDYLFNKDIWLHPSARHDYVIFIVNRLLKAFAIIPVLVTMAPIAISFSSSLEQYFGNRDYIDASSTTIMLSFTIILFIFDDFTRFLLHYLLHKVPALWEFHKVHHSAKVLTPMTIYRSHPVESLLYGSRMALTQGIAVGLSYYLFGPTLAMIDILGANAFVFLFNIMGSNLRHSHIWLSWGNWVEYIFISPAQHQIHHSNQVKHFDRNFGSALAIWDKLFGCHVLASTVAEPSKISFGISKKNQEHQSLTEIYLMPFKLSFLCCIKPITRLIARVKPDS
ncbi:sterol desaturase family protein [Psychrobium sp. 1_MG-2023]|uniref:sterol desaturase family protein n=1 Tax=Psychrobium sp. 1_MG-2023 TaxID=3062624 RepID=UPI000C32E65B|nr:sterol desaturase family protein [Psychrobium sp. 1_MG-2023]MDP2561494.1 sterol desaturase family protein [Psychrobium sp. 1_MG-2023]PKF57760.1 sterol desaturase family protein [Alteromonadales bacterium alter-6D02]